MSKPRYPRGSEWRKWDLQVHTPYSALNNGFGDDFDEYAKRLIVAAIEKEIAVVGVTDYFTIEGYTRLKGLLKDKERMQSLVGPEAAQRARSILFLPNVELRTSVVVTRPDGTDSRVNFHVVFSEELRPETIEEHFLRELKFTAESNPASPDERWSLTGTNLANLGKTLKAQHAKFQDRSDLYVGMMTAVVSHEDVTRVLESQSSRFKDRYLIVIPADEDLSECNWNGQGHLVRKLLIQKAHLLMSGNAGTRAFSLGRKHETVERFLDEFKSLKPCARGSDAHNFDSLFQFEDGRPTWIKADPTFRGLRQLLHEPEDRVWLGVMPPSLERINSRPTRVVDSIHIRKAAGSTLAEKWFDSTVELNGELVAIIGNKGNGKSALADVLGLLGNSPRSTSFSFLREDRFRDPKNNKAKHFEASLTWADATSEGPTNLAVDPEPEAVEKIKYIPQNYLEEICNEVSLGRSSRFYQELQQVIFSHVPTADRLGFDTLDELLDYRGAEVSKAIELLASELHEINRQILSDEERSSPRFRRVIERQLAEKRRELQAHEQTKPEERTRPEVDPLAQKQAQEASAALDGKRSELATVVRALSEGRERDALLAKRRATADRLLSRLRTLDRQVQSTLGESSSDFAELNIRPEDVVDFKFVPQPIEALISTLDDQRSAIAKQLDASEKATPEAKRIALTAEIEALKNKLTAPQREYELHLQRLAEWTSTREVIAGSLQAVGSIAHLEGQLKELENLPGELKRLYRARDRKMLEIYVEKRKLRGYYETYYGAVQRFLADHPTTTDELFNVTFTVAIVESGFAGEFLAHIDQRKLGPFAGLDEGSAALKVLLDAADWNSALSTLRFTRNLLKRLKTDSGRPLEIGEQLKQDGSLQQLYDIIFSLRYLSPIYRLTWEGKGLEQLSPGERGNLLLLFYLLVDQDDLPLVIDQPEENLDNQTVVKTLVPCMKLAKKRRQIVMVTHNPNLAVVCDAEQVIYAEIRKDNQHEVAYSTGSIEDPEINQRIVDVLEGTRPAFDKRDSKYLRVAKEQSVAKPSSTSSPSAAVE